MVFVYLYMIPKFVIFDTKSDIKFVIKVPVCGIQIFRIYTHM